MAASSKLMIVEAERRFPCRIKLGVPIGGFGGRLTEMHASARPALRSQCLDRDPCRVARPRQRCGRDLFPRRDVGRGFCSEIVRRVECRNQRGGFPCARGSAGADKCGEASQDVLMEVPRTASPLSDGVGKGVQRRGSNFSTGGRCRCDKRVSPRSSGGRIFLTRRLIHFCLGRRAGHAHPWYQSGRESI